MTVLEVRQVRVPVATLWTGPDAPRDVDAAAVLDVPDIEAWSRSVVTTELPGLTLSQLLLGEPVRVLEEADGWSHVWALSQATGHAEGTPRGGYPGWLRTAHLGAPVEREEGVTAVVARPQAECQTDDGRGVRLSFGTLLWVDVVTELSAHVLLPDGVRGSLSLRDVALNHKRQQPTYGPDDVLARARQFLGLKYVWGGTSGWGLDCSGLVHLTYRSLGVALPRDASDMVAAKDDIHEVPLDEVQAGDLYFFAKPGRPVTHVGFASAPVAADGTRVMLHAPEGGGRIEECPMTAERLATLVSAGRVRKPDCGQLRSGGVPLTRASGSA